MISDTGLSSLCPTTQNRILFSFVFVRKCLYSANIGQWAKRWTYTPGHTGVCPPAGKNPLISFCFLAQWFPNMLSMCPHMLSMCPRTLWETCYNRDCWASIQNAWLCRSELILRICISSTFSSNAAVVPGTQGKPLSLGHPSCCGFLETQNQVFKFLFMTSNTHGGFLCFMYFLFFTKMLW